MTIYLLSLFEDFKRAGYEDRIVRYFLFITMKLKLHYTPYVFDHYCL